MATHQDQPVFHLYDRSGWVNDPNGPLYYKGQYHMFFQNVTDSTKWTWGLSWGHATSTDLLHWRQLPPALSPDPGWFDADGCFSGCATIDTHGKPAILYTGVKKKPDAGEREGMPLTVNKLCFERQLIARPADADDPDLRSWVKVREPFLWDDMSQLPINCFRDPFVLEKPCDSNGRRWRIMVGSNIQEEKQQPDAPAPPTHLFSVSAGVCPAIYWLGRYADGRFDLDAAEGPHALDLGDVVYAPNLLEDGQGRQLIWAWLQEFPSPDDTEVIEYFLRQTPLPELASLRSGRGLRLKGIRLPAGKTCAASAVPVITTNLNELTGLAGCQLAALASISPLSAVQTAVEGFKSSISDSNTHNDKLSAFRPPRLNIPGKEDPENAAKCVGADAGHLSVVEANGYEADGSPSILTPAPVGKLAASMVAAQAAGVRVLSCQLRTLDPDEPLEMRLLLDYSILELFMGTGPSHVSWGLPSAGLVGSLGSPAAERSGGRSSPFSPGGSRDRISSGFVQFFSPNRTLSARIAFDRVGSFPGFTPHTPPAGNNTSSEGASGKSTGAKLASWFQKVTTRKSLKGNLATIDNAQDLEAAGRQVVVPAKPPVFGSFVKPDLHIRTSGGSASAAGEGEHHNAQQQAQESLVFGTSGPALSSSLVPGFSAAAAPAAAGSQQQHHQHHHHYTQPPRFPPLRGSMSGSQSSSGVNSPCSPGSHSSEGGLAARQSPRRNWRSAFIFGGVPEENEDAELEAFASEQHMNNFQKLLQLPPKGPAGAGLTHLCSSADSANAQLFTTACATPEEVAFGLYAKVLAPSASGMAGSAESGDAHQEQQMQWKTEENDDVNGSSFFTTVSRNVSGTSVKVRGVGLGAVAGTRQSGYGPGAMRELSLVALGGEGVLVQRLEAHEMCSMWEDESSRCTS
eukprot:gene11867-12011_t